MFVLVEDAFEAIAPADVEVRDLVWAGDRCGLRVQWRGVRDSSMGSMGVVVPFVLAQGVQ